MQIGLIFFSLQKLYTTSKICNGNADLCMIVAKASNITLEEIVVENDSEKAKELKGKCATGFSLPFLELEDGTILTQTTAICEYLAETGSTPTLLGTNSFERAQVDQWMSILRSQTIPLAMTLSQAVFGNIKLEVVEHQIIQNEMKDNAKLLNK